MVQFIKKYRHGLIILAYAIVYMLFFEYLECRPVWGFHVIDTVFDDYIPFCEYFIVPYLLWFPYQILTVLYFIFRNKNKKEYYQLIFNMMMGMTVFLIVSYAYPNVLHLRPSEFPRENVFTDMVRWLYRTDTPTNVLPSIHVFNSLAACIAIAQSEQLKKHPVISNGAYILAGLIILATMFLKQHSVIDVMGAVLMAYTLYQFVYATEKKKVPSVSRSREFG